MTKPEFPWYTGKGDSGMTSLIGGNRVPKYHEQPETYGTIDEATSCLGMARSFIPDKPVQETIISIQRDLYRMMSELAVPPENSTEKISIDESRIRWLETKIDEFSKEVRMPKEFIISGNSRSGAILDVARAVIRRAERKCILLFEKNLNRNPAIPAYLNRLSSLCYVLARREDQESGALITQANPEKI
jgi:cob(I)alamin adenosyltransferase